jgi:hypothetical protein
LVDKEGRRVGNQICDVSMGGWMKMQLWLLDNNDGASDPSHLPREGLDDDWKYLSETSASVAYVNIEVADRVMNQ